MVFLTYSGTLRRVRGGVSRAHHSSPRAHLPAWRRGGPRRSVDVRRSSGSGRCSVTTRSISSSCRAALRRRSGSNQDAWAAAIARSQAHTRDAAGIAAILAAQQERRGAPPRGSRSRARGLPIPARVAIVTGQQAGAFGGPLFTLLKAVTAIQLAQRASAEHGVPAVAGLLGRRRRSRLGRSPQLYGARRRVPAAAPSRSRDPEGAGELPSRSLTLDDRVERSDRRARARAARDRFTRRRASTASARAYRPGVGMAEAFRRWIEAVLGPHGLVVFDSSDPAAKPLVAPRLRARAAIAGTHRRARGARPATQLTARGHHAAGRCRSPTASRSFTSTARGTPIRQRRRSLSSSATTPLRATALATRPNRPGAVQPERAAAADRAGHALPDHLLRRRPERARVSRPASRRLRALRRADAADLSARHARRSSTRRGALPQPVPAAARGARSRRTKRR